MKWVVPSIFSTLWWKFMPGVEINVKWPAGKWFNIDEGVDTESADPNDHYRPWLEEHVGKQGWDWDWRIGRIAADNDAGTIGYDSIKIKCRKGKEEYATIMKMMWA